MNRPTPHESCPHASTLTGVGWEVCRDCHAFVREPATIERGHYEPGERIWAYVESANRSTACAEFTPQDPVRLPLGLSDEHRRAVRAAQKGRQRSRLAPG